MEQLKQQLQAIGKIMWLGVLTLGSLFAIGLLFVKFASFLLPLVLILCCGLLSVVVVFWVGFIVACTTNKWDLIRKAYGDEPEVKDGVDIVC